MDDEDKNRSLMWQICKSLDLREELNPNSYLFY